MPPRAAQADLELLVTVVLLLQPPSINEMVGSQLGDAYGSVVRNLFALFLKEKCDL